MKTKCNIKEMGKLQIYFMLFLKLKRKSFNYCRIKYKIFFYYHLFPGRNPPLERPPRKVCCLKLSRVGVTGGGEGLIRGNNPDSGIRLPNQPLCKTGYGRVHAEGVASCERGSFGTGTHVCACVQSNFAKIEKKRTTLTIRN